MINWDKRNWKTIENGDFKFNIKDITEKTFDETARKWALVIANSERGVKSTQLRKFYDEITKLNEKALNISHNDFAKKVLPFVKMVRSKVYNAKNKQPSVVNEAFVIFMDEAISQITTKDDLANFKFLFEAVVGFYQQGRNLIHEVRQNNNQGRRR